MALSTIGTNAITDSAITSAKTTIGIKVAGQFRFTSDFAKAIKAVKDKHSKE